MSQDLQVGALSSKLKTGICSFDCIFVTSYAMVKTNFEISNLPLRLVICLNQVKNRLSVSDHDISNTHYR